MKISELEELAPPSAVFELHPNARYLIVVENCTPDHATELDAWINGRGIDAVVFPAACRLFEIEKAAAPPPETPRKENGTLCPGGKACFCQPGWGHKAEASYAPNVAVLQRIIDGQNEERAKLIAENQKNYFDLLNSVSSRPHKLVNELEREIIRLNEDLRLWRLEFRLWRGAWLRHLGGVIVQKSHEIDGFGLRHDQQLKEAREEGRKAGLEEAAKDKELTVEQAATLRDLVVELQKHSNDHIHDESEIKRTAAAVEGVIADRLNAALNAQAGAAPPKSICIGYPDCDGDLEGEEHYPKCPLHNPERWAKWQEQNKKLEESLQAGSGAAPAEPKWRPACDQKPIESMSGTGQCIFCDAPAKEHAKYEAPAAPPVAGKQEGLEARWVDIVFDGSPGPDAPTFVEVEDHTGKSIKFGDWIHRTDGYWVIRIPDALAAHRAKQIERLRGLVANLRTEGKQLVDRSEQLANFGEQHRSDLQLARGRELEGVAARLEQLEERE